MRAGRRTLMVSSPQSLPMRLGLSAINAALTLAFVGYFAVVALRAVMRAR